MRDVIFAFIGYVMGIGAGYLMWGPHFLKIHNWIWGRNDVR